MSTECECTSKWSVCTDASWTTSLDFSNANSSTWLNELKTSSEDVMDQQSTTAWLSETKATGSWITWIGVRIRNDTVVQSRIDDALPIVSNLIECAETGTKLDGSIFIKKANRGMWNQRLNLYNFCQLLCGGFYMTSPTKWIQFEVLH